MLLVLSGRGVPLGLILGTTSALSLINDDLSSICTSLGTGTVDGFLVHIPSYAPLRQTHIQVRLKLGDGLQGQPVRNDPGVIKGLAQGPKDPGIQTCYLLFTEVITC